ncbi:MAG: SEC-C domain-containing protein [Chlamydiia bacterium]|nr:SEC-C domain-containing protein [Chlamydiia bacterium]
MKCPCHSGKDYQQCCMPYHEGTLPKDALTLMRSRYSGYALGKVDYIIDTSHPDIKKNLKRSELEMFCKIVDFHDLKILKTELVEPISTVTFRAILKQNERDISFTEKSFFEKIDGRWIYTRGELSPIT